MQRIVLVFTLLIIAAAGASAPAADGTVDTKSSWFIGTAYVSANASSGSSKTVIKSTDLINSSKAPFVGLYLCFFSGTAANQNEMRKITAYDAASGSLTLASGLSATPVSGDRFSVYSPNWTARKAREVSLLSNYTKENIALSKYGGRLDKKETATGYFHTFKAPNGRWWFIDPDGYYYENMAVVSVTQGGSDTEKAAASSLWGSKSAWADYTTNLLKTNGFNGVGAWSDTTSVRGSAHPMAYNMIWNFMSGYGDQTGRTTTLSGHNGYPNDCIFVFDPDFKTYCDNQGSKIAATKNDPYLLGHYSDNELPFKKDALNKYLALPTSDYGYKGARAWMDAKYPGGWTTASITTANQQEFLGYVIDKYMSIVNGALKKYDPNHMYLGSRFYGDEKSIDDAFVAAGKYCSAISVNIYGAWDPYLGNYLNWSGKPIIVTEWYAMGLDSGLPCTTGAGFVVETQKERGYFYQHFTLALLQSKACVGWQYFMYQDNDPTNLNTDPSNRTSNKGIVTNKYVEWNTMLAAMKEVNTQVYSIIDHFDGVTTTPPTTTYSLNVINGGPDGSYTAGTTITITANAAPTGQVFDKWTGATVASATSATTTLVMPAAATTVTATYKAAPPASYTLIVAHGTFDGTYVAGSTVTITANAPAAGQVFDRWTGATVASATSAVTTLVMPAANTTVTANYKAANTPPAISSAASASPNPAATGDAVTFTVAASDKDNQTLTYTWDFGDGTSGSGASAKHSYSAAGTYAASVTVSDGQASVKSTLSVSVESIPASIKINFQLAGGAVPSGYLADNGKPYGDRGNGFSYGWNMDTSSAARDRNSPLSADQRYDTLIHLQKPENPNASWRIKVPNGSYTVHVVCGDPSFIDSVFKTNVENVLTVNATPTTISRWASGTQTVTINDGYLTITNATGAKNNKICYIDITHVAARSLDRDDDAEAPANDLKVLALKGSISSAGAKDGLSLTAQLSGLPADFKPADAEGGIDVLGAVTSFTFDKSGRAKNANATAALKYNAAKKAWTLAVTLKKIDWKPSWSEEGLNGIGNNTPVNIPVGVRVGDQTFGGEQNAMYSSKGKTAKVQ